MFGSEARESIDTASLRCVQTILEGKSQQHSKHCQGVEGGANRPPCENTPPWWHGVMLVQGRTETLHGSIATSINTPASVWAHKLTSHRDTDLPHEQKNYSNTLRENKLKLLVLLKNHSSDQILFLFFFVKMEVINEIWLFPCRVSRLWMFSWRLNGSTSTIYNTCC